MVGLTGLYAVGDDLGQASTVSNVQYIVDGIEQLGA